MNLQECLSKMIPPGQIRPNKPYRGGVIQVHVTRACDKACVNCTQLSQLAGKATFMPPEMFEQAVLTLKNYFGVVGLFGGNPALSPHFDAYCDVLLRHIPFSRRGIWCNNPVTLQRASVMRRVFDPSVSNLNVHLDRKAYDLFKRGWPECNPVGLTRDSRHSPCYVSMKDVGVPEEKRWELISDCDINRHWSAMMGMFRGKLRAWFCEIAGAQAMHHQDEPDYPDTGTDPAATHKTWGRHWWEFPMPKFQNQVSTHCHDCGVPLRGRGELATGGGPDQVSEAHSKHYRVKGKGRAVELVTTEAQLGVRLGTVTHYLQNADA